METIVKERFLMKFKKEKTESTYNSHINMFYDFILEKKSFDTDKELLENITFDDVEDYFYYMDKDDKYKKSTINLKIEVLKELFDYAIKKQIMPFNLTNTVEKYSKSEVKKDKTEKYVPTINEIKEILDSTYEKKIDGRCQDFTNARDRFLIALLLTTGLRIDEALGIEDIDVELISNGLYMINVDGERVKNGINKRVPITKGILKYYYEYEKERDVRNRKFDSNLLFFSINGKKLNGKDTNKAIKKFCQIAKVSNHITNHCFRHFLTKYLKSIGANESMMFKIMGWVEKDIDNEYDGEANDKEYDDYKLKVCDVLR